MITFVGGGGHIWVYVFFFCTFFFISSNAWLAKWKTILLGTSFLFHWCDIIFASMFFVTEDPRCLAEPLDSVLFVCFFIYSSASYIAAQWGTRVEVAASKHSFCWPQSKLKLSSKFNWVKFVMLNSPVCLNWFDMCRPHLFGFFSLLNWQVSSTVHIAASNALWLFNFQWEFSVNFPINAIFSTASQQPGGIWGVKSAHKIPEGFASSICAVWLIHPWTRQTGPRCRLNCWMHLPVDRTKAITSLRGRDILTARLHKLLAVVCKLKSIFWQTLKVMKHTHTAKWQPQGKG